MRWARPLCSFKLTDTHSGANCTQVLRERAWCVGFPPTLENLPLSDQRKKSPFGWTEFGSSRPAHPGARGAWWLLCAGCQRARLRGLARRVCGGTYLPPRQACPNSHTELVWTHKPASLDSSFCPHARLRMVLASFHLSNACSSEHGWGGSLFVGS